FTPHSHNLFLQIFIETGIVGLFVFIGVLAFFIRAQANFLRRVKEFRLRVFSAAMIAAIVGFIAQGTFDHNFYNYRVMLAFYLFIGIGIAFTRVADPGHEAVKEEPTESEWVKGYHD
ncbi:MAG: O-antigen ligase family protein, partial [Defluviitaleaceae bacterium]|nr:O-antigen ligase family protein [Defluviitaleaceae bacterium]